MFNDGFVGWKSLGFIVSAKILWCHYPHRRPLKASEPRTGGRCFAGAGGASLLPHDSQILPGMRETWQASCPEPPEVPPGGAPIYVSLGPWTASVLAGGELQK